METRSSPSLPTLHSLARQAGLTFDRLSKPQLFQRLKEQCNFERLQRARGRALKRHSGGAGGGDEVAVGGAGGQDLHHLSAKEIVGRRRRTRQKIGSLASKQKSGRGGAATATTTAVTDTLNIVDPILLTDLSEHTFRFVRPNGSVVLYDVSSLIDFLLKTGNFLEPETRLELSDAELKRLDLLAREAKLDRPSVYQAKHHPEAYVEMRFRRDALMGLERCAGELVTEMLQVVENADPEDAEMKLVVTLFPLFTNLFKQIETADKEWARQCMAHFIQYMKGPPNRPTQDPHGFLSIILSYMQDLRDGGARSNDF